MWTSDGHFPTRRGERQGWRRVSLGRAHVVRGQLAQAVVMAGGEPARWWLDNIGNDRDVTVTACDLRRWLTQRGRKGKKRLR